MMMPCHQSIVRLFRAACLFFLLLVPANAQGDACSQLKPGDVFVWVVATDDPHGIGFMALEAIPAGLELYLTDNPWTGTEFGTDEGTQKLVVPAPGYAATDTFGLGFDYGAGQNWTTVQGLFNVGTSGDDIFLYCLDANQAINHLVAFNNAGAWADAGMNPSDYGPEQSALPDSLVSVGSVVLPHMDNYEYKGPMKLEKADLQQAMMDPINWEGTDDGLGDQTASTGSSAGSVLRITGPAFFLTVVSLVFLS